MGPEDGITPLIADLVRAGLLTRQDGRWVLTPDGRERVMDAIEKNPVLAATLAYDRRQRGKAESDGRG